MKKFISLLLTGALSACLFAGCGGESAPTETTAPAASTAATEASVQESTEAPKSTNFTLVYPDDMKAKGFTEDLVLDYVPQKIVCFSSNPVLALYELGANLYCIPESSLVEWPKELDEATVKTGSIVSDTFNIETIIAMEPDLVVSGLTAQEKYDQILKDAGIPVYYVNAGGDVGYESVKAQTMAFIDAFAPDSEAGNELIERFAATEQRVADLGDKYKDMTCMVIRTKTPDYQIQAADGTFAAYADMMGFQNVFTETTYAPIDLEKAISYDPDVLFCGPGTLISVDELKVQFEEEVARNSDYWNNIKAVKNGDIIYFPSKFMMTTGIQMLDNINEFIDTVEAHFGA